MTILRPKQAERENIEQNRINRRGSQGGERDRHRKRRQREE